MREKIGIGQARYTEVSGRCRWHRDRFGMGRVDKLEDIKKGKEKCKR